MDTRTACFMQTPTDLSAIPSGMDNDPKADEEVINQQQGNTTRLSQPPTDDADEVDNLTHSIAYAIDGSGNCFPGSTPVVGAPQTVVTEGTTGAELDEEV